MRGEGALCSHTKHLALCSQVCGDVGAPSGHRSWVCLPNLCTMRGHRAGTEFRLTVQKVEGDRRPLQKELTACSLSISIRWCWYQASAFFPLVPSLLPRGPHLIDSEVDASVGDDSQHVGDVAFVEGSHALFSQDPPGTVQHARVLACFPQGHPGLQNLQ